MRAQIPKRVLYARSRYGFTTDNYQYSTLFSKNSCFRFEPNILYVKAYWHWNKMKVSIRPQSLTRKLNLTIKQLPLSPNLCNEKLEWGT
jgi:hypothetical protein